jgi:hypothetical protein
MSSSLSFAMTSVPPALGLVLGRGARRHAETGQDRGGGGGGADLGACSDELPAADAPFDECGFDALERCP